jgi:hypothetical protein
MGLREKLSTSFGLRPDAGRIATNESNASGLKFPTIAYRATSAFKRPITEQRIRALHPQHYDRRAPDQIYFRARKLAAMMRGLRRPWSTAITASGFSSGA